MESWRSYKEWTYWLRWFPTCDLEVDGIREVARIWTTLGLPASLLLLNWFAVAVVQSLSLSNSLRPHGLGHTRLLYPPLSPRVCSNSCSLSWLSTSLSFLSLLVGSSLTYNESSLAICLMLSSTIRIKPLILTFFNYRNPILQFAICETLNLENIFKGRAYSPKILVL